MKITCQFCHNQWFLTDEAMALAVEQSPKKGRSIGIECPRCRKLVKIARPKRIPNVSTESENQTSDTND